MNILRTIEVEERYRTVQKKKHDFKDEHHYDLEDEVIVQDFEFWHIFENKFPYDGVTDRHDLLIPKRIFSTLKEVTSEENAEYEKIVEKLDKENIYDSMLTNFSKGRSVRRHLHIHLIVWKKHL